VLVSQGKIQMAGEVEDILACHRVLIGPTSESKRVAADLDVVQASSAESQVDLVVRSDSAARPVPPRWEARSVTLEELTLAYLRERGAAALPGRTGDSDTDPSEVTT
jgi:ABC-2 type transport system ATP-binding protein